jgi:hypothetical protein
MLPRNYRSVAKELPFIWSKPGTDLGVTSRQFECAWSCRLLDTVWVGGSFQIELRLKWPRISNELQVQRIFGTNCGFLWSACRSDSRLHASKKRKNWERRRHHQLQPSRVPGLLLYIIWVFLWNAHLSIFFWKLNPFDQRHCFRPLVYYNCRFFHLHQMGSKLKLVFKQQRLWACLEGWSQLHFNFFHQYSILGSVAALISHLPAAW